MKLRATRRELQWVALASCCVPLVSCELAAQPLEKSLAPNTLLVVQTLKIAAQTAWTAHSDIEATMRSRLAGGRIAVSEWILRAPWIENLPETPDIVYWLWNRQGDESLLTVGCGRFNNGGWSGLVQYAIEKQDGRYVLTAVKRQYTETYSRARRRYQPWAPNDARLTQMTVHSDWWALCDALPDRMEMQCDDQTVQAYPATVRPRYVGTGDQQGCAYDAEPIDVATRACTISIPRGPGLSPLELPTSDSHPHQGSAPPCRSSLYFFEDLATPITCYTAGGTCAGFLLLDPKEFASLP